MWTLPKPLIADAIADVARVIEKSDNRLNEADGVLLKILYRLYDSNDGSILSEEDKRIAQDKRDVLYSLYNKTQQGGALYYIRKELLRDIDFCPMCGISAPSQLDHQMPREDFRSLSVCRLNLVPTCSVCNNKKRKRDPSKFVHPYYSQSLINLPFFEIEINSSPETHRMSWKFNINKAIIPDRNLATKIESQVGVVKLFRRLYKETNIMLSDILNADISSQSQLDFVMKYEYGKYANNNRYGMNDWRCVFLRSLIESPHFTIEEARVYAGRIKPVNGGVNA